MNVRHVAPSRSTVPALGRSVVLALPLVLGTATCRAEGAAPLPRTVQETAFEAPASGAKWLQSASPPYPASVQAALDDARGACREAEAGDLMIGPGLVRAGDLTDDRRTDFVVDFRQARCAEIATLFGGTGGWDLVIFVARQADEPVRVYQGRVLDDDFEPGSGRRTMRFQLHGSSCGRVGPDPCRKSRGLSARPFTLGRLR